jgi:ribonuclease P protein component
MLAKLKRVSRPEFTTAYAAGQRYHSPFLTLVCVPGPVFKASVVVSKKVAKKAHDRNRLRRRLYEVLSALASAEAISGTILVLTKPPLATLTKRDFFAKVPGEIAQLLNSK